MNLLDAELRLETGRENGAIKSLRGCSVRGNQVGRFPRAFCDMRGSYNGCQSRAFLTSASKDEEVMKAFTPGGASAIDRVIASEAKQSHWVEAEQGDCFVAQFLAMITFR
jgi:hypothetical protein